MDLLPALLATLPGLFGPADLAALAAFLLLRQTAAWLIERDWVPRASVTRLMDRHRADWVRELGRREVRIMDSQLLTSLRTGAAFFASTCLLAIGGVAALIGQTEQLVGLVRDLGAGEAAVHEPVWEAKLLLVLLLVVDAFLKFVWSHRLFGYSAVLMGAVPAPGEEGMEAALARLAAIDRSAARSFNRGLRGVYFSIAALAWFLGPWAWIAASLVTFAMLMRREFFSASRAALAGGPRA